jgi:hypothetical protein
MLDTVDLWKTFFELEDPRSKEAHDDGRIAGRLEVRMLDSWTDAEGIYEVHC